MKEYIIIKGAFAKNLKNISLTIPKNSLVVCVGVAGSGTKALVLDVLYAEARRVQLQTMGAVNLDNNCVTSVENLSPAILLSKAYKNSPPETHIGTVTGLYDELRTIFASLASYRCDRCHGYVDQNTDQSERHFEDSQDNFIMLCPACNYPIQRLSESHFSFTSRHGQCPTCFGKGTVWEVKLEMVLDETKTLKEGGVIPWKGSHGKSMISLFHSAVKSRGLSESAALQLKDYPSVLRSLLLYGSLCPEVRLFDRTLSHPKPFKGIVPTILAKIPPVGNPPYKLQSYLQASICPSCKAERLQEHARLARVGGLRFPELATMNLQTLSTWLLDLALQLTHHQQEIAAAPLLDVTSHIRTLLQLGLGYLPLDRSIAALNGGENQRLSLAGALKSTITGMLYILDEPTSTLHPKDTQELVTKLKELREKGNSVLVVDNDLTLVREADDIIELGPGSGIQGGTLVGRGALSEVLANTNSLIRLYLNGENQQCRIPKQPQIGFISVQDAHVPGILFPLGLCTAVCGVPGSGKRTLVFEKLAKDPNLHGLFTKIVSLQQVDPATVDYKTLARYMGLYKAILALYAQEALQRGDSYTAQSLRIGISGGLCSLCKGRGRILFQHSFPPNESRICPSCQGRRFQESVLSLRYGGYAIDEILALTVEQASYVFANTWDIQHTLTVLQDVGLAYLQLGLFLHDLSAGEAQRLLLAKELSTLVSSTEHVLFLMDEPSLGLHHQDIDRFIKLTQEIVRRGSTIVMIEYTVPVLKQIDWIIELGLENTQSKPSLLYSGPPQRIDSTSQSIIARYLQ